MQKKSLIKAGLISLGVIVAGIGSSFAYSYFTDSVQFTNNYKIGTAGVELTQPNYIEGSEEKIIYGKHIPKNPIAENTGNIKEYIKIEVEMPVENNVSWVDKDNNFVEASEETYVDVFRYELNDGWKQIGDPALDESKFIDNGYNTMIYSYLYDKPIKPKEKTPAIFEYITLNKITQGQLEGNSYSLPMKAYAIQADGFTGESVIEELSHAKTEEWVPEPDEQ